MICNFLIFDNQKLRFDPYMAYSGLHRRILLSQFFKKWKNLPKVHVLWPILFQIFYWSFFWSPFWSIRSHLRSRIIRNIIFFMGKYSWNLPRNSFRNIPWVTPQNCKIWRKSGKSFRDIPWVTARFLEIISGICLYGLKARIVYI